MSSLPVEVHVRQRQVRLKTRGEGLLTLERPVPVAEQHTQVLTVVVGADDVGLPSPLTSPTATARVVLPAV